MAIFEHHFTSCCLLQHTPETSIQYAIATSLYPVVILNLAPNHMSQIFI